MSIISQTLYYEDGSISRLLPQAAPPTGGNFRLPAGRRFARLKHDYELYKLSRPSIKGSALHVNGLPETVKVLYPAFVPLTQAWQLYGASLLSLAKYRKLYRELDTVEKKFINQAFSGFYVGWRFITNKHGWDNGLCDYINGVNIGAPPMDQETITTAGNVVELLSNKMRLGGKDVYKVRTLDGTKNPPDITKINPYTEPWLFVKATISRREEYISKAKGWRYEDRVIAFPQLNGPDCIAAFMGKGEFNYIDANRIDILPDNAELPNPYTIYIR